MVTRGLDHWALREGGAKSLGCKGRVWITVLGCEEPDTKAVREGLDHCI